MKKKVLLLILESLFVIIFNVMFFLLGGHEGARASRWISYAGIHIAYALMIITPILLKHSKTDTAFGFPISAISAVYFVAEFLLALIFVLFNPVGWKACFLMQLILLAIYAVFVLVLLISDVSAREKEAKKLQTGKFVGDAKDELTAIMKKTRNSDIIAVLDTVREKLEISSLDSVAEALPVEDEFMKQLKRIKVSAEMKDLARVTDDAQDAKELLSKRNSIISQNA